MKTFVFFFAQCTKEALTTISQLICHYIYMLEKCIFIGCHRYTLKLIGIYAKGMCINYIKNVR